MMRRRIAIKKQNLCFFCSFRSTIDSLHLASSDSRHVRAYNSRSSPLRGPAGAAAAERRGDEEEGDIRYRQETRSYSFRPQPARNGFQRDNSNWSSFNGYRNNKRPHDTTLNTLSQATEQQDTPRRRDGFGTVFDGARGNGSQTRASPPVRSVASRSRTVVSGFDAFAEAVGSTQSSQQRTPNRRGGHQRGRFSENQTFSNPATRSNSWNRPSSAPREATPRWSQAEEPALDESIEVPLSDPVPEAVNTHRRKPGMRSKRSDRYADENEEEDLSAKTPVQKGKRSKERSIEDELEAIEEQFYGLDNGRKKKKSKKPAPKIVEQPPQHRLEIPEFISVQNMAQALNVRLETFMQKLEEEGFEGARYDHLLDSGTASMFAELYGFDPVLATAEAQRDLVARPPAEDPSVLPPRPPIVTIMGHVDHGKTTILDYLRKANVVASEHGGITQHIGAFSVTMPGTQRTITFLDTPGHAAFLDMRRRGANVTDIVVLVVAADDSVKPQTEEAIKHALDANVQVIVAINKVDKEDANVDRVKQDLSRFDITVEDYGGDYQAIALSGKTGQGMAQLEEAIITLADVSDYRAEIDGPAEGWIIESKVTSAGRVATVLVRRGTLRPGDFIVAGNTWARVRTLRNDQGDVVSEAPPGTPVQIDGWRGEDPTAGLEVLQANDEQHAKQVVDLRLEKSEALRDATDMAAINAARSEAAEARAKVLAWQSEQGFASRKQARVRLRDSRTGWLAADESGPAKVHFVVKADVAGSVEALVAAISSIGNKEIQANIIHSGTGQISESDIRMLAATGEVGYAVSFNQPVDGTMYRLAEAAGLEVLDHNVIYKMTDVVTEKVAAELPPLVTTKVLGEAEIGQIFDVTIKKVKHKIAGCKITNGTISRSHKVRVIRGGDVVYTGSLNSLKNVKKDVTEMRKGSECGIAFDEWEEMQEGDKVQCFEEISEKRKLY